MRKLSLFIFIIVCVNMMIVPQSRTHEPDTDEGFDNVHYRTTFVFWYYENGEQARTITRNNRTYHQRRGSRRRRTRYLVYSLHL